MDFESRKRLESLVPALESIQSELSQVIEYTQALAGASCVGPRADRKRANAQADLYPLQWAHSNCEEALNMLTTLTGCHAKRGPDDMEVFPDAR